MSVRDNKTEQLIKDTAKRIFFAEGKLHATTQEIADAAGINRTLLHYYFRSRDILFKQVFEEAMLTIRARMDEIFESGELFKEKIEKLIAVFLQEAILYPYREIFVITELNSNSKAVPMVSEQQKMQFFLNQIEEEMKAGNIKKMDPRHFVMNLFALMAYPLIAASLNKNIFNLNNDDYLALMHERKAVILQTIYS
ncbi:TetR/AcrR family transcriptional regulator [Mucilaginibacter arboris]|uniref:TetR family transcriptional regulator n=1 Tax=Mucilaginibacter arboris TaxID=2682090 RepID=A0A7K1SYX6_9SPHI|nr:TetR/AcrR family transcriptional regulator [Mucilaginibacter arboris]MVN22526.1 TetR family transcriptional regulator [Mucilaginibacter arboris]